MYRPVQKLLTYLFVASDFLVVFCLLELVDSSNSPSSIFSISAELVIALTYYHCCPLSFPCDFILVIASSFPLLCLSILSSSLITPSLPVVYWSCICIDLKPATRPPARQPLAGWWLLVVVGGGNWLVGCLACTPHIIEPTGALASQAPPTML